MKIWQLLQQHSRDMLRSTRVCIAMAVAMASVIVSVCIVLDARNTEDARGEAYESTERMTAILYERLATRIDRDVSRMRMLANLATVTADDAGDGFAAFAEHQLKEIPHLVSIGVAPDFQLKTTYPQQWISGHASDKVRAAMEERLVDAQASGQTAAAMPEPVMRHSGDGTLTLVMPLVNAREPGKTSQGAIVVVIDQKRFLEAAKADPDTTYVDDGRKIKFALRDSLSNIPFAGDRDIATQKPVSQALAFPGGSWDILATPAAGWNAPPENQHSLRTALAAAAIAIIVPIFIASLLIAERNRNIDVLQAREARLFDLSQRFKLALDSSHTGIWEIDEDGQNSYMDERAANLHGFPMQERTVTIDAWLDGLVTEDRAAAEAYIFNCICGTQTVSQVYRIKLPNDNVRYLRSAGANYEKPGGGRYTSGIIWDVTADMLMAETLRNAKHTTEIKNAELELALEELSAREQDLEDLSGRLDLALQSYNCGIWEMDLSDNSSIWDERMHQLYNLAYSNGYVSQRQWLQSLHADDREHSAEEINIAALRNTPISSVRRVMLASGDIRHIRSVGQLHRGRNGARKVVGIAFDITADVLLSQQLQAAKDEAEAKNAQLEIAKDRIEHNSLHDPLTGLGNRRKLDIELDALSHAQTPGRKRFALLHLDLDRFKQINDTLGHAAGDAMLTHASTILQQNVNAGDMVARIGGDEFVIVVRHDNTEEAIRGMAARIIAAFSQPLDFQGFSCRCGVSIGVAFAEGHTVDARKTLINADLALYRAKGMGRSRYEFFTQNLQAEIISNKRLADEILAGLEKGEFETWYQPQFCARSMQLTGAEALVRWNHPTRGILTPDQFLKIAEDLNVVATLDRLVLETALRDKRLWNLKGIALPKVSVNVSSRRLNDETLIEGLVDLQINPGEISFELVESIFLDESDEITNHNLDRIKALGIDIEIDDFGTGHTSIVSLLKLKPKRLKIDRQLVMPILTSPRERSLVRSIVDIARSLGIETVAEGVETMEHARRLGELGCDLLQGYAFARPLPAHQFSALAAQPEWRKVS